MKKIKATVTLYEQEKDGYSFNTHTIVETQIEITLPVPDPETLAPYIADQIRGFLALAGVVDTESPLVAQVDPDRPWDPDLELAPDVRS